ncbi:hypothetical protein Tco_1446306, partial [Tanacetum coccineum]
AKVIDLVLLGSFGGVLELLEVLDWFSGDFEIRVQTGSVNILTGVDTCSGLPQFTVWHFCGFIPPPIIGEGRGGNPPPARDNPPVVLISNLDAGNPLHVHNSDNSSSILVPFKLLGTENYRM